jgi:hypothetical protein
MIRAIVKEHNGYEMFYHFVDRKDLDQYCKSSGSIIIKILPKR